MMSYDKGAPEEQHGVELVGAELFQSTKPRIEALCFPLHGEVLGTCEDPDHYLAIDVSTQIMIPIAPHPGAFGVQRRFHTHEGVDLYCDDGAPVIAMESGTVVAIEDFTGSASGSPWWLDTKSLLVAGEAGVVCYGEIEPDSHLRVGDWVSRGQQIGVVKMVLAKDKGRPRSMLHLELHTPETNRTTPWDHGSERPITLLDPTGLLVAAARTMLQEGV